MIAKLTLLSDECLKYLQEMTSFIYVNKSAMWCQPFIYIPT